MPKLTWGDVHEMRRLCAWFVLPQASIASLYGVSQSLVAKIDNNHVWKSPERDHVYYARQYPGYDTALRNLASLLRAKNRVDLWPVRYGQMPDEEKDDKPVCETITEG